MAARCPICTQELEDVSAVRRHTLVAHGVDSEAPGGAWSSLPGPPGEPGWHPDPWNSTALRHWDGSQWSGKTAALGSVPDDGAKAAPKRRWGRSAPAMAAAPASAPAWAGASADPSAWAPPTDAPTWSPPPASQTAWGPPPDPSAWGAPPDAYAATVPADGSPGWGAAPSPPVTGQQSADPNVWAATPPLPTAAPPTADPNVWAATPPLPTAAPPFAAAFSAGPQDPMGQQTADLNRWAPAAPRSDAWAPAPAGHAGGDPASSPDQVGGATTTFAPPAPVHPGAPSDPAAWIPDAPPPSGTPWNGPPPTGTPWNGPAPADTPWNGPPPAATPWNGPPPSGTPWNGAPPSAATGQAWAPPTSPAPKPNSVSTRSLAVIIGVGVLALALVASVVLGTSSGHAKGHGTAAATTTTLTPPTTAAPAITANLSEGVLNTDDLGGAWAPQGAIAGLTQQQVTQGPCGSPLWAHDVAGFRSQFTNGGGSVVKTGNVTSQVREAASETAASAQAAYVTSTAYGICLRSEATVGLQATLGSSGLHVDGMAIDPLPLDQVSSNKLGYVITAEVVDATGSVVADISIDHVEVFSGRYEGTLDVETAAGLGIDRQALIQAQTARLVQRMAQLPPQGTITSRGV